jgi:membrane protein involved in D-alanine export
MTPYADFSYFGLLLYPLIPTVLLGLGGRISRAWILLATLIVLAVQYSGMIQIGDSAAVRELWLVLGFALTQWLIAAGFLRLRARGRRRWAFYGALALGLLPLAAVKLLPLLAPGELIGFLGISYVTFRSLDVTFGIQDGVIIALPLTQYCAFLLFFPAISAGPIDRYRRFSQDWERRRTRAEFLADLDSAIHQIFTGFLYKFILAYLIKQYWMDPAASAPGLAGAISYMYAYSGYLFFDFAGYSAFAVGLSLLFGVHTPRNFNRPFLASDIREFWNRWHISLSAWFRDHVYMRFVLAAAKGRWFKRSQLASYAGFFLSMGLMGLWHGPQLHYILYGLYHGALLTANDLINRWGKRHPRWGAGPLWRLAGVGITFHLVCFGFLLFSGYLIAW